MATSQKVSQSVLEKTKSTRMETTGDSLYAIVHTPQVDKRYPTNPDGSPKRPVYRITVKYPNAQDPQLKELKANIKAYGIKRRIREVYDAEGNETGEYTFTFEKTGFKDEATGEYNNGPIIVDKYNHTIPKEVLIGNGSKVKVVYNVRKINSPSGQSHMFQLLGVQVLNLVKYSAPPMFTPIESNSDGDEEEEDFSTPTSF